HIAEPTIESVKQPGQVAAGLAIDVRPNPNGQRLERALQDRHLTEAVHEIVQLADVDANRPHRSFHLDARPWSLEMQVRSDWTGSHGFRRKGRGERCPGHRSSRLHRPT